MMEAEEDDLSCFEDDDIEDLFLNQRNYQVDYDVDIKHTDLHLYDDGDDPMLMAQQLLEDDDDDDNNDNDHDHDGQNHQNHQNQNHHEKGKRVGVSAVAGGVTGGLLSLPLIAVDLTALAIAGPIVAVAAAGGCAMVAASTTGSPKDWAAQAVQNRHENKKATAATRAAKESKEEPTLAQDDSGETNDGQLQDVELESKTGKRFPSWVPAVFHRRDNRNSDEAPQVEDSKQPVAPPAAEAPVEAITAKLHTMESDDMSSSSCDGDGDDRPTTRHSASTTSSSRNNSHPLQGSAMLWNLSQRLAEEVEPTPAVPEKVTEETATATATACCGGGGGGLWARWRRKNDASASDPAASTETRTDCTTNSKLSCVPTTHPLLTTSIMRKSTEGTCGSSSTTSSDEHTLESSSDHTHSDDDDDDDNTDDDDNNSDDDEDRDHEVVVKKPIVHPTTTKWMPPWARPFQQKNGPLRNDTTERQDDDKSDSHEEDSDSSDDESDSDSVDYHDEEEEECCHFLDEEEEEEEVVFGVMGQDDDTPFPRPALFADNILV